MAKLWALLASVLVLGTAAGNILVCLAIAWERRLQNVTNYFLMSLAITDLMVAILVMPVGILTLVTDMISYLDTDPDITEEHFEHRISIGLSQSEVLSVHSRASSIGQEFFRSSSYGDELGYYLKSKAVVQDERDSIVNSMRHLFGEYQDCCGILSYEGYFKEAEKGLYYIQFTKDGNKVVVGFGSGTTLVYGTRTYRLHRTVFEGRECGHPVNCIRFHPQLVHTFYVCTTDKVYLCSDIKDQRAPIVTEKGNEITAISIDPTGITLVTVGKQGAARLYDVETCGKIKEFKRSERKCDPDSQTAGFHTNRLYAVRFNPDDKNMFVTGGWDSRVKLWDPRVKDRCIDTIKGPRIFGEAVDVKCGTILTGSWTAKKKIQLWDVRKLDQELLSCAPKNTPPLKEGYFVGMTQFFDGDPSGDVILVASMPSKSFDVVSLKHQMVLHSFMTSNVVVGNHSSGTKVSYGGMLQTLRIADFYMDGVKKDDVPQTQVVNNEEEKEPEDLDD